LYRWWNAGLPGNDLQQKIWQEYMEIPSLFLTDELLSWLYLKLRKRTLLIIFHAWKETLCFMFVFFINSKNHRNCEGLDKYVFILLITLHVHSVGKMQNFICKRGLQVACGLYRSSKKILATSFFCP